MINQDTDKTMYSDGNNIEVVDRFSYVGDVFSTEGSQEAVIVWYQGESVISEKI